ncbi:NAD(P)-binding protein [Aaosphaeria arxii CBS 175.79]|uniref:NAD(P)-binding protein n=1 Tax=Aaosphaeria arxii CBS 175.79 TaxID=1450172 RepID=A0A6A5X7G7_9PLEO|nr:NAD(P)-binding protein [Aaosphaeria arxii CBS 175.79]KAF2008873.1 NAD(P)-binding protein [Aaosphaeria arxii CBS 175.79]
MSMSGKVIGVTGAGSGIGRATAMLLSRQGATLSLTDLNQASLDQTVELLDKSQSHNVMTMVVNVVDTEQVHAWIRQTVAKFKRFDGAANVAGIFRPLRLEDSTISDWDLMMDVNAKGVFHCLQAQIRAFDDAGGSIVTVASSAGVKGLASAPIYAASKHAVIGLCSSVAQDVACRKIRVNTVAPGLVDTPMTQSVLLAGTQRANPMNRAARVEEIASVVVYLLSDDSSFVTGACWRVDGGYTI